jgi:hypothetical protein
LRFRTLGLKAPQLSLVSALLWSYACSPTRSVRPSTPRFGESSTVDAVLRADRPTLGAVRALRGVTRANYVGYKFSVFDPNPAHDSVFVFVPLGKTRDWLAGGTVEADPDELPDSDLVDAIELRRRLESVHAQRAIVDSLVLFLRQVNKAELSCAARTVRNGQELAYVVTQRDVSMGFVLTRLARSEVDSTILLRAFRSWGSWRSLSFKPPANSFVAVDCSTPSLPTIVR